ncbi:hypothetical protein CYMTET_32093, partial [Cymbomonas tetramitiformis]
MEALARIFGRNRSEVSDDDKPEDESMSSADIQPVATDSPSALTRNDPPWVELVNIYVDQTGSEASHAQALESLVQMICGDDGVKFLQLVQSMDSHLNSTDITVRARGTILLAEVVSSIPDDKAANSSALAAFFAARLSDWPSVRGALKGLLCLLRREANATKLNLDTVSPTISALLKKVHVQSHPQPDRQLCFEVLLRVMQTFPSACAALGPEFPDRLISAVDGEKDPRCLLLAFQLWQALPLVFQPAARSGGGGDLRHLEEHAEELCDVMACYFPIVFTAPPGDKRGVTREMLQQGLKGAFTSTPVFTEHVLALILSKLGAAADPPPSTAVIVDSLDMLSGCIDAYGAETMLPHISAV